MNNNQFQWPGYPFNIINSVKMKYDPLYLFISPVTGYVTNGSSSLAQYIIQTPDSSLPNAQSLSTIGNGVVFNTVTDGVGVLSASQKISLDNFPDLAWGKIWQGDFSNRPQEVSFYNIPSLPSDSLFGNVSIGVGSLSGLLGLFGLFGLRNSGSGQSISSSLTYISSSVNMNMENNRIENISSSPGGDYDAINAKWVWDLLNGEVEVEWE